MLTHDAPWEARALADAEAALEYQAQLQRAITDNAASGLLLVDATGHTTYMNPAAITLLGFTLPEMAKLKLHEAIHHSHPDGRPYPSEECPHSAAFYASKPAVNVEEWLVRKDGTFFPASVSMTPLFRSTEIAGAVYEFRDATEQHRAWEALSESDSRKDQFLAILGHELRNPIATIQNAMQVLARKPSGDIETDRMRAIVLRQAGQLHRLVDELLDVARIQTGKFSLSRSALDLRAVARSVIDAAQTARRLERHAVSLSTSAEAVWVDGDQGRLEQLLGNLLDNAVKFTPERGAIRISVEARDGRGLLTVTDEGYGIDESARPRLFQLFAQADQPLDRPFGGLGVGLALARAIAELHGGSIAAESAGTGQGSTFTVQIPLAPAVAAELPLSSAAERGLARRVVLVEDSADAREAVGALLAGEGHHVSAFATGREAIGRIRELRPHIAFIDVGLPEMDGYAVARAIRANGGEDVHLVALTGYGRPQDVRRALAAGFDTHITKPAGIEQLAAVIAAVPERAA